MFYYSILVLLATVGYIEHQTLSPLQYYELLLLVHIMLGKLPPEIKKDLTRAHTVPPKHNVVLTRVTVCSCSNNCSLKGSGTQFACKHSPSLSVVNTRE